MDPNITTQRLTLKDHAQAATDGIATLYQCSCTRPYLMLVLNHNTNEAIPYWCRWCDGKEE